MKKILFTFIILLSINLSADDHIKPEQGAFTSLYVSASDVDKYVSFLRKNSDAFKAIGSSDAGVCITRSGNQYPGQMMIWNAFPSVEAAMIGSLKYDPYKATGPISNLRNIKHSTIWKSLKSFRLEPGHEIVGRFKVKQENISSFVKAMDSLEKEIQDNGHPDFFNGVFVSIAGGAESQTLKVRSITSSASDQGKIADEYFSGKYKSFNDAIAFTEGFVDEQIQVCEQIYKK
ncbi:MAG: hypothetical protein ACJ0A2_05825 [Alphaproteobacteria bacterium]|nr:hypothetical protein [Rhodobiaceae bacterium]|tara:strand:- start:247 stop:942 length:696 start_codon:yes stop_codon:yes gene_type:complete